MSSTVDPSPSPNPTPDPPTNSKPGRKQRNQGNTEFDPWAWRPAVSVPTIESTLNLHSVFAQKLLQTLFGRLQVALYGMSVTIPIMERDRGSTAADLQAIFERSHQRLKTVQQQSVQRYTQWLAQAPHVPTLSYQVEARRFSVFCPNAHRALEHFQLADQLIRCLDQLWYASVLDATQHKRAVLETCAQVRNFTREMDGLWVRSKAAVLRAQRAQPADQGGSLEAASDVASDTESALLAAEINAGAPGGASETVHWPEAPDSLAA